jgi:hypothetical protein
MRGRSVSGAGGQRRRFEQMTWRNVQYTEELNKIEARNNVEIGLLSLFFLSSYASF